MSRYPIQPVEFTALRTVPLASRGGKVRAADFAAPYQAGAGVAGLLRSMPRLLAGEWVRALGAYGRPRGVRDLLQTLQARVSCLILVVDSYRLYEQHITP